MMPLIGGVSLSIPLIVAAGVCKTPQSVEPYLRSDVSVGAVVTGSYTPEPRTGNTGNLFWPGSYGEFLEHGFALNAFGMPNVGVKAAALAFAEPQPRPVIASVAGFSVEDYVRGVWYFSRAPGVVAIELNFGCPNAHEQKAVPIAYDLASMHAILRALEQADCEITKPIWVKLSPYLMMRELIALREAYPHLDFSRTPTGDAEEFLSLVWDYAYMIHAVVMSNTLGNVRYLTSGVPVTTPNDGQAGLSGPILKEAMLRLVAQARLIMPGWIDVIACGGITTGDDAADALEAGASAVACASGPAFAGPRFYADLIAGSERLQNHLTQGEGDADSK